MQLFSTLTISLFLFASPAALYADSIQKTLDEFPSRVERLVLQNGIRVLMVDRPATPTVSFASFIRTGGVDDAYGKSGIAHMFEHMLFKGTKTIGTKNYEKEKILLKKIDRVAVQLKDETDPETAEALAAKLKALQKEHESLLIREEFWKIYERAGARGLNAGTGYDYTSYTISLPANRLELWAKMESDRLRHPVLREFYKERDVVLEERRMRVDNSPKGTLWENFLAVAFTAHPYGRPLIGHEQEIARLTVSDAHAFFERHYDVNRLVIVIVGGFDRGRLISLLKKNFENLPASGPYQEPYIPVEPPQQGERRVRVLYDAEPSLVMGFHRPNFQHPDNAALEVLSDVLSTGRTSRLYKEIVQDKKMAVSAWASSTTPGERDNCLFTLGGSPKSPHTTADLEQALLVEIEKIKQHGPSEEELTKVKNFAVDYLIRAMQSNSGMAWHLGYYEALAGDWTFLLSLIRDIQNVTKEDVIRVANVYLTQSNRTVGVLIKQEAE